MTDGGYGADYTFEATGNVKVMAQAVEAARMAWGLCTVAGVAGKGETLDVIPRWLITGRRVAGSSFGGVKGREGVPKLVDLYMQGEIDVDPFISHRITLDEVNQGFELMEAQDGIRIGHRVRRMILQRVENADCLSNAYLAVDEPGGTGVLIDSNGVTDPLAERAERERTTITHILLTHHHWDHVFGLKELAERFGGVPVLAHPKCRELLDDGSSPARSTTATCSRRAT